MDMGRTSAMASVHVMIEHLCIGVHGVFSEESRRIAGCSVCFVIGLGCRFACVSGISQEIGLACVLREMSS
jgi:hypothetical protein